MKNITKLKTLAALAFLSAFTLLQPAAVHAKDKPKVPKCTMTTDGKLMGSDGKPMGDCMMMRDGKMHIYHDGKSMIMTETMTMDDGSNVYPTEPASWRMARSTRCRRAM